MTEDKFHFLPLDQATASRAWAVHQFFDSWWVVHPEKGLAFFGKGYGSPQCNKNESISRRLCPAWGEVKFIEYVKVPLNVSDYNDR